MVLAMLVGMCSFVGCTLMVLLAVMDDREIEEDNDGRSTKKLFERQDVPGRKLAAFLFRTDDIHGYG